MDEQNYVVVRVKGRSQLQTQAVFLHNTKVTSSKMAEYKDRQKDDNKVQGRCISHMEMVHMMLKYPEVVTNLKFVNIATTAIELRSEFIVETDIVEEVKDGIYAGTTFMESFRISLELDEWRLHTVSQQSILNDLKSSNVSVDKITEFGLRPPELLRIIPMVGQYYRWFYTNGKKVKKERIENMVNGIALQSCFIDGLQRQVFLREMAIPELVSWCDDVERNSQTLSYEVIQSIKLMRDIITITVNGISDTNVNDELYDHILQNIIYSTKEEDHLPIPVYSYIKPTISISFLLHIMLSMGEYETEIDLLKHVSLRECFRCAKLIGPGNTEDELEYYASKLTKDYIVEQLQYFPNSQKILDSWIIMANNIFRSVIVHDEIPLCDMPSMQLTTLLTSMEENDVQCRLRCWENILQAALEEIGERKIDQCCIKHKDLILNAKKSDPLDWDGLSNFRKSENQSMASYMEQRFAIKFCIDTLDMYCNILQ